MYSSEGNWKQREDIPSGERDLASPMEAQLRESLTHMEGTTLVSTLLERDIETSALTVYGKTSLQKYVHPLFDEIPTDEEDGINNSNIKENSVQLMEQSTDSEFIAYFAINFSDVENAELLSEETRLTKVEQNLIIVGSSLEIPEASSKRNRSEKGESLIGERHPVNQPL